MRLLVKLVVVGMLSALWAACGGGTKESSATPVKFGDISISEHGTKDVTNATSLQLEADSYYFEPTYVKGAPGQKLKVTVKNATSDTLHNFSVPSLQVDKDMPAKSSIDVDLTFPQSGVLLFLCKYHTGQGMNGELLAGNATPQAASAAPPSVKVTDNSTLGKIVTDASGRTLYINKNDIPNSGKSTVSGQTLAAWPAFSVTSGSPVKQADLPGDLAVITRDDGAKQIAYKGMPLYYFSQDNAPGDTNGQGRANVWFVVNP